MFTDFDGEDIEFRYGDEGVLDVNEVETNVVDGKTVAVYTLEDELDYDGTYGGEEVEAVVVDKVSANIFGDTLEEGKTEEVKDKITPEVAEFDENEEQDHVVAKSGAIEIKFTEEIDSDSLSKDTFEVLEEDDGTTSVYEINEVSVDGNMVTIELNTENVVPVGTNVNQKNEINDVNGNSVSGFELEVVKAEEEDEDN